MATSKPAGKVAKIAVSKVVPMPKSIYQTTRKKPEPDNYPARPPKGASARAKRLKGVAL